MTARTDERFVRFAGAAAIGSQVFLLANGLTWLLAADFDLDVALYPSRFVSVGPQQIGLLRGSLALDVVAYLLWIPLVFVLRDALGTRRARMWSIGGLTYAIAGALGAAVLIGAWPPLIRAFAGGADAEVVRATFSAITDAVYRGMWNIVAVTGLGTWLIATGYGLRRQRRKGAATVAIAAGGAALADAVVVMAGAHRAALVTIGLTGLLAAWWGTAIGIELLLHPSDWTGTAEVAQ